MDILKYFPIRVRDKLRESIGQDYDKLEEIRVRVKCPIILKFNDMEKVVDETINNTDTKEILQCVCENSIYAYQNEINHGYITIMGGHRVGITGNCVIEDNRVINISFIYSLNFRIAREKIGAGNEVLKYVLDLQNNSIFTTLIVSPPGAGKTTVLRDLVRQISNGIDYINFKGKNVSVADERGEIAAMYKGIPQNDVGIRTDILDNVPKWVGMEMLIRSMAPDIIVADEIGNVNDVDAINYAVSCGVKGIFTAHGGDMNDLNSNLFLKKLIDLNVFERIIFLDKSNKGMVKDVYHLDNGETDCSKGYRQ